MTKDVLCDPTGSKVSISRSCTTWAVSLSHMGSLKAPGTWMGGRAREESRRAEWSHRRGFQSTALGRLDEKRPSAATETASSSRNNRPAPWSPPSALHNPVIFYFGNPGRLKYSMHEFNSSNEIEKFCKSTNHQNSPKEIREPGESYFQKKTPRPHSSLCVDYQFKEVKPSLPFLEENQAKLL